LGWQLEKCYSPKFWSLPWASRRDAGKLIFFRSIEEGIPDYISSIVEFGNPEDAQRAVRELSEMTLLGRPVYIREVTLTSHISAFGY
jgi:hypothetical protein